jgi:hypothetical protein
MSVWRERENSSILCMMKQIRPGFGSSQRAQAEF